MRLRVRWTEETAAREFGIDSRTLTKRIIAAEVIPGKDRKYSTPQICAAVFGDIDGEKLRLVREQADKISLENSVSRRELVSVEEIAPVINRAIAAIKARIDSASNMEREDKDKIMQDLGKLWDGAFGTAPADKADVEPATTA